MHRTGDAGSLHAGHRAVRPRPRARRQPARGPGGTDSPTSGRRRSARKPLTRPKDVAYVEHEVRLVSRLPDPRPEPLTRRTWLHRLLAALAATGSVLLEPPEPAAAQNCHEWCRCTMHGRLCSCRGGSDQQCPPGTVSSTQVWHFCCYDPRRNRAFIVASIDCCAPPPGLPCPSGCWCARGDPQPNWCPRPEQQEAICARARVVGLC